MNFPRIQRIISRQIIGGIRMTNSFSTLPKSQISNDLKELQKLTLSSTFQQSPKMLISFTCKVCQHRSHKSFSKHSYEKGVVIIKCEGCSNNHLIADNLGFTDSMKKMGKLSDFLNEKISTNKDLEELLHVDEGILDSSESSPANQNSQLETDLNKN